MKQFWEKNKILILAIPLLILPAWELYNAISHVHSFVKVEGQITGSKPTECSSVSGSKFKQCWKPIAEYQFENRVYSTISSSASEIKKNIGEPVSLLVNRSFPSEAYIDGFVGYWGKMTIHSILSLSFFCLALGARFIRR